jgi:urea transport system substrate-binding protein
VGFFYGSSMSLLRLGILFSTNGAYGALGRDCRDGAELAVKHLSDEGAHAFTVEPVFGDPAGCADRYMTMARAMMRDDGCRHIVGAVTSQARKDVIPIVEKHDGQLWYVCPYEGFEANENVIYTGACPNQHLIPLFETLMPRLGQRVYLAGANYIWGWEMNRLAREIVTGAGGEIVGERCLPIEDTDVDRLIADIAAQRPDFILSNLIGPSSYAFLRAMRALADRDPRFRPERCPVVSCDLTECELSEIGLGVADGQLSVAPYFDSLDTPENRAFKARVAERFGAGRRISSFFATAYATVRLCADAVARCGGDDPRAVRAALHAIRADSVLGPLVIDAATNHASLPFHLARIAGDGFAVIRSRPKVAADPYMVGRLPIIRAGSGKAQLRIVS